MRKSGFIAGSVLAHHDRACDLLSAHSLSVQALIATQIVAVIVAKCERSICAFPALDRVGISCFRLGYTNVGFVENCELRADGGFWPACDRRQLLIRPSNRSP
jgi:hypothetical protein